jgi:hypothetical protein
VCCLHFQGVKVNETEGIIDTGLALKGNNGNGV